MQSPLTNRTPFNVASAEVHLKSLPSPDPSHDPALQHALSAFLNQKDLASGQVLRGVDLASFHGLASPLDFLSHIHSIRICDAPGRATDQSVGPAETGPADSKPFPVIWTFYFYFTAEENLTNVSFQNEFEEDSTILFSQRRLPHQHFEGLWESLVYESDIKSLLCSFVSQGIYLAAKGIDTNIVSWNKLVLLHGPPGSGKTQLCRSLAHKMSIRMQRHTPSVKLIELNANSLFSRWFSQSGKIISQAFNAIREELDEGTFVFILIDEVESLTAARAGALQRNEPSDALRAVNAVLTQLDAIRQYDKVLVMATSNITTAIDDAFLDRADIKQYVGLPGEVSRYTILKSCIEELQAKDITHARISLLDYGMLTVTPSAFSLLPPNPDSTDWMTMDLSLKLFLIAKKCKGLSGRSLRKLPVMALAKFSAAQKCLLQDLLEAFERSIDDIRDLK